MKYTTSFKLAMTSFNAALYTVIGYITYLGIYVGGIKFWPAVVIPAFFAVTFGKYVGGIGAAIGIFIADVLTHGDWLLSLAVGVPANFIAFYILGALTYGKFSYKRYLLSATLSLAVGSLIIGFGLMAWSQVFILPGSTDITPWTLTFALIYGVAWTFGSEILFLIFVVPPIVKAFYLAFPEYATNQSEHKENDAEN
ncbi:MAG: hypothetical protein ACTSSJ_02470 [Candidatus Odinarchaeia archaeon]